MDLAFSLSLILIPTLIVVWFIIEDLKCFNDDCEEVE